MSATPSPLERLSASLAPAVVEALLELIDQRVAEADPAQADASPWLSIGEAAPYLKVSERTIEREIERGRLGSTTIGRRRLVHRNNLDALARAATGEDAAPTTSPRHREE
jgi:excisionase family DNA binding protein